MHRLHLPNSIHPLPHLSVPSATSFREQTPNRELDCDRELPVARPNSPTLGHCPANRIQQDFNQERIQLWRWARMFLRGFGNEVRRKHRNIFLAFAERRQNEWHYVESKRRSCRNLPSSTSFSKSRLLAAISRISTARVFVAPTRSKTRSCNTRNSNLNRGTQLTNFIQKKCAAVRQFESALSRLGRIRKCAFS